MRRRVGPSVKEGTGSYRLVVLNQKPAAEPGRPGECRRIVAAADASPSITLYGFPNPRFTYATTRCAGRVTSTADGCAVVAPPGRGVD